jgi:3-dehydroquinate dehydratase/shikimate dehydrogenase
LVAVPVVGVDPPLAEQVEAAASAGADLVELRLDLLGDDAAVAELLRGPRLLPMILTLRTAGEGGACEETDAERAARLGRLAAARPGFVDVEYASWAQNAALWEPLRAGGANRLILSHHDWRETPADLEAQAAPLLASSADVVKLVFRAGDVTDAWRVLAFVRRHAARRDVIALTMGEAGLASRVLAKKFGAFLTFASGRRGAESAPGQPTVEELRTLYRWDEIGADTAVYGVVGWPVAHSRSPHVHNAAMAACGIDGVYVPMPVRPTYEDLAALLDYLDAHAELGVRGLSVTVPHKEHARRWLLERGLSVIEAAQRAGAANTLTWTEGGWAGDNTDVAGVRAALAGASVVAAGRRVAVLGAGGVARAVVSAVLADGGQVTVYNRTAVRAEALARELGCDWGEWSSRTTRGADVAINCTSVGMTPAVEASPMPAAALGPNMVVVDAVYTPAETRLLREARAAGARVVGGEALFIGQAAGQFGLWHGQTAPREVMRRALAAQV